MNVPEDLIPDQAELYIRFHGNPSYEANYEEAVLLEWAQRIKTSKAKNSWLYFNNTRLGNAPYNALLLSNILK